MPPILAAGFSREEAKKLVGVYFGDWAAENEKLLKEIRSSVGPDHSPVLTNNLFRSGP